MRPLKAHGNTRTFDGALEFLEEVSAGNKVPLVQEVLKARSLEVRVVVQPLGDLPHFGLVFAVVREENSPSHCCHGRSSLKASALQDLDAPP